MVTDKDGVLVRLEGQGDDTEWNGIALGSIWDERVAGTNGVSMALSVGQEVTVRGKEHFYARLQRYSCSGVPLRNASNEVIGVASLSSLDRGLPGDGLFAQQLLSAAASRVQQTLFLRDFKDAAIVSVAMPGRRELIKGAELVAVDDQGVILGATSAAHLLSGVEAHSDLTGQSFAQVFGTDLGSLDRVPGRVVSVRRDKGPLLDLWTRTPMENAKSFPGFRPKSDPPKRRNLPSTYKDLAVGSQTMAALCERAQNSFDHGVPMLIEGETGTGKSMLVKLLLASCRNTVTVDCASLSDTYDDRGYIHSLIEQAHIAGGLDQATALVFDNVNEMPSYAQNAFRSLLEEAERGTDHPVRILSTSRKPLREAVLSGAFRDDVYYLLSGMSLVLPPVRAREKPDVLARAVAAVLAEQSVDFHADALQAIADYDWPGNVREMRNVLRQALLQGDGKHISALDLAIVHTESTGPRKLAKLHACDEEALILDALQSASWNVSRAARTLGMGRATIHRKMKAFGISRPT
ncbi:sigma-54-dependent Fis family transcriptional regulator [Pacificoceanicola onchidii]|uniref:sigma-54-dependent Fis family transcriptional regulator n=1 Tax=Pacificoceanicola onchidii TaxID=2562685 RepID=UPI001455E010|nr:sigma 54-interacting transcriptional regulator [Pacificoceanicola onchidii]